jgi:hypothetical protein
MVVSEFFAKKEYIRDEKDLFILLATVIMSVEGSNFFVSVNKVIICLARQYMEGTLQGTETPA